ncbi:hypothetical protein MBLNU230_g6379t1 [Neophaeotheca triangularis]
MSPPTQSSSPAHAPLHSSPLKPPDSSSSPSDNDTDSTSPDQLPQTEPSDPNPPTTTTTVPQLPTLTHRLQCRSSILALTISASHIFAGTQNGEILVYSLKSFELLARVEGHKSSVLGLCLDPEEGLLFSAAGDRVVNVWGLEVEAGSAVGEEGVVLKRRWCLRSSFDVGDVFCVAYSERLGVVYLGAQNTTVQWCGLRRQREGTRAPLAVRDDPFFDSRGPGGVRTPKPPDADRTPRHAKGGTVLEIGRDDITHFAHNGYVYCMLLARDLPEAAGRETLVTAGGDGVVKLWRLNPQRGGAPEEHYTLDDGRDEGHSILSIALDGTFLFSGRSGGEVDVWDLETRQLVRNIKAHRDDVLTISVGGGFLFSAAVTGYVRKFDRQYEQKGRFKAHDGRILASAFTARHQRPLYVTGAGDHTLAVWDVSDCVASPMAPNRTSDEKLFEALRRFVSYRTVSSDQHFQADCRRCASYLRGVFKQFGAQTEMLPTPNGCNPVIMARFRGNPSTSAERKKILFYGHYDVVAAENVGVDRWRTDPFVMEGIDGYCYGRGTSDNKGPIMAAIFACGELKSEQALGSDIIFLIEGEEESGSRGFETAVKAAKERIGPVDWILLANSYWLDDRMPCLTYGLRGVVHASVQVDSKQEDLHSGVDGSKALDEPVKDLVALLATLSNPVGEVMIPGFYDPVLGLHEYEKSLYADITQSLVQRNPDLGDREMLEKSLMARWREATLTIHRFETSGPKNAAIIPRMAKAALSFRLVPEQEATKVADDMQTYLAAQFKKMHSANRLTITVDHKAEPWLGDTQNEIYRTLEEAIMEAWGPIDQRRRRHSSTQNAELPVARPVKGDSYFTDKPAPTTSTILASGSVATPLPDPDPMAQVSSKLEQSFPSNSIDSGETQKRRKPLYIREGGSIPAIRFLEKEFEAPAAHLPCGQASDAAHLDNERFRLVNLHKARDIFKKVFRELPVK